MRIIYYIKQLLPFTYWSKYKTPDDNRIHFAIWRQWFGRIFNRCDFVIYDSGNDPKNFINELSEKLDKC